MLYEVPGNWSFPQRPLIEQVGQAVMVMCEEEKNVEMLRQAPSPGVDFYGEDCTELRIATYQGYLSGETPKGCN